ncbi:MAG: transglycosylase SLT domain-containing protein [Candidatus Moranbacteria bacterium]|nr:transglycosylase SLT domain-containing protein [Candidatus Moranbacteria bacterium]
MDYQQLSDQLNNNIENEFNQSRSSPNLNPGNNFRSPKPEKQPKPQRKNTKILSVIFYLIILLLLSVVLGVIIYGFFLDKNNDIKKTIFKQTQVSQTLPQPPKQIDFCSEKVPLGKFYVNAAWQREFYILAGQDYQNMLYLKRSNLFFPYIEQELEKRNMPDDLKYLAVAESALVETAISSKSAAGIWQFIPSTAKKYDLIITDEIDQRHDFEKATQAALDYLEDLYDDFDNWTLAAAAYNMGENNVKKSLKVQKVTSYYDLYLNQETSRYLFRILAIKELMSNHQQYGYNPDQDDYFFDPEYKEVEVQEIKSLSDWSKKQGSNLRSIKELNPWLIGYSITKPEPEELEPDSPTPAQEQDNSTNSEQTSQNPTSSSETIESDKPDKTENNNNIDKEAPIWRIKVPINN